jgi:hypothetical protein
MANRKLNNEVEPVITGQVADHIAGANKKVTADAGVAPATQAAEPKDVQTQQDAEQGAQASATATETPKVSNITIKAGNEAQRSLSAAENTIDDARGVKVLQGSVSEGNVTGEVQAKKNEANAMGAEADARLDAETFRNGDAYRGVQTISARDKGFTNEYASRVIQDLKAVRAQRGLTPNQRQLYQYALDYLDGKFDNGTVQPSPQEEQGGETTAMEQKVEPNVEEAEEPKQTAQPQEAEVAANVERPKDKGEEKQEESEERKGRSVDTGVVDAKGRTAEQVIDEEGYERDKSGNIVRPKPVSFTPADNSSSQYDKDLADLEREYAKKVEEATRKKDEALERIMDDTSTISDKADAIERMAAADEVIKRYSSPGYAKRMHATKILAMLSDALSAIGNVLTATHGGVAMKVDSASEKVRKEEKANEAALQKRIDYWTKRMESARSSDAKASNFLRSRNMTSAIEAYKASTRLAKDTFTSGVGVLNNRYRRSGDALKAAKATVDAHNKRAYDYEKQRREQTFKHNENVYKEKQQNRRTDKNNATKIKTQKMRNKNKKEGFSLF